MSNDHGQAVEDVCIRVRNTITEMKTGKSKEENLKQ